MANRDFNSIEDLLKYLDVETKSTIQQKNSKAVNVAIDTFIESIDENVYDAYNSPAESPYQRLREHGGLTDKSNFDVNNTSDGIAIENVRKGVDRNGEIVNVLDIIEGNLPYSTPDIWGYGFEEPRHVAEPTADKLRSTDELKNAFKLDLKARGLKTD